MTKSKHANTYLQLEALRFDAKFCYSITVSENIGSKSVHIPALIIQPFVENAIWHGIVPLAIRVDVFH